ncbi:MAG: metallophosphoesterase family protein [Candidatus Bathyarchaeota archaeon]|jgi:protein phosphatase|nr:serine/threonine protein phosphatase [Candidatus Bathyarchaeota archaeon A05DMB-3]MDH7606543.1 metallophosphoesterase family protein [Candidatus Bathyarchaeota archaeon]
MDTLQPKADLSKIVKEAFEVSCEGFCQVAGEAVRLIEGERGKIGNFHVLGRLIKLEPVGEALIVGDLHGDLESLIDILKSSGFPQKLSQDENAVAIFLGDYGDRGYYSAEVYYTLLKLKLNFPRQIILMRGNHEGPEDLMASPHDLPWQFQSRFDTEWMKAYTQIRELFNCLYNAVLVEDRYLMVHGGPPPKAKSLEDLAYAHVRHPKESLLEDLLWSDPTDAISETCASPRGAGKLFGEKVTNEVLQRFCVKVLIRGHEPCQEGYKIDHNGKILTLFSRKGPPYFNENGAYLLVQLSQKTQNTTELIKHIHKF